MIQFDYESSLFDSNGDSKMLHIEANDDGSSMLVFEGDMPIWFKALPSKDRREIQFMLNDWITHMRIMESYPESYINWLNEGCR